MDKVTEIRSGINDIQMSSKFLLKRVNKIKDDGDQECTCHHESKSIETEIRRLQSHMKSLEDKVMTTDESRLNTDLESMMERLGVLESKFQQKETDNTASRSAYTNSYTEPRLNTVSGNESHERRQLSDKSDVTQKKDKTILKDNTENVERLIGTGSESFENRSQVTSKQSTGRKYKSNLKSEIAIPKPNFTKPNKSGSCFVSVGLIKQDVKLCYDGEIYWRSLAQNELDEYRARYMFLEGVHSIICLDVSESMANSNAWTEARTFITDYLTGLEKMKSHATDIKTEYVALVTFGHQTKIQVGYTDDFRNIEKELDKTKLGGPTQMYGGVLMALAAAMCSGRWYQRIKGLLYMGGIDNDLRWRKISPFAEHEPFTKHFLNIVKV